MPFKSQAQRRKFGSLVSQGKMSQSTFDTWNKETGSKKLPDRIGPKKDKPFRSVDQLREHFKKRFPKG